VRSLVCSKQLGKEAGKHGHEIVTARRLDGETENAGAQAPELRVGAPQSR